MSYVWTGAQFQRLSLVLFPRDTPLSVTPPSSGAQGTCPTCHTLDTPLLDVTHQKKIFVRQPIKKDGLLRQPIVMLFLVGNNPRRVTCLSVFLQMWYICYISNMLMLVLCLKHGGGILWTGKCWCYISNMLLTVLYFKNVNNTFMLGLFCRHLANDVNLIHVNFVLSLTSLNIVHLVYLGHGPTHSLVSRHVFKSNLIFFIYIVQGFICFSPSSWQIQSGQTLC